MFTASALLFLIRTSLQEFFTAAQITCLHQKNGTKNADSCAALTDSDTGRIAIYYGCADSYVGIAFTTVQEVCDYILKHDSVDISDSEIGIR